MCLRKRLCMCPKWEPEMITTEFLRKMTAKHQAAATEESVDYVSEERAFGAAILPRPPVPVGEAKAATADRQAKARKAADTRIRNKHGRSREEIDALLRRDYREKGPTLLAQELRMKVTTVMMRARRMGLSADPQLSALRRVATRLQRKQTASES
jgi:hypothetical protein